MRIFTPFLLAAGLLTAGQLFAADAPTAAPLRKVAIIVENRAGAQLNDKVARARRFVEQPHRGQGLFGHQPRSDRQRPENVSVAWALPCLRKAPRNASAVTASHTHATAATTAHDKLEQATVQHTKENDSDFGSYTNDFEASQADTSKYHRRADQCGP